VLHVSLLGGQAITDDRGGSIQARSSRVVVLIAFLVMHAGSAQARQRIAGLLWPESTDAQALTNLRRELHHLRQILGDEPSLVVTPRDLCWHDTKTCRVDVRVFDGEHTAALAAAAAGDDDGMLRHASAAIAAYRGELLPGVYDDWLLDARAQLERQCVDLYDLACAAWARAGDLARAVEAATRALDLADPESELAGQAHFIAGCSAFSLGMPADGLRHFELGAQLASGAVWLSFGTRPDVHGKAFAGHAHWLLGHQDEALAACREAITLAGRSTTRTARRWPSPTAASPTR